jgi:hypothetical protein
MSEKDLAAVTNRFAVDSTFVSQLVQNFDQAIEQNGYSLDEAEMARAKAAFDASGSPPDPPSLNPNLIPPISPTTPSTRIDPDVKKRQKAMGDFTLSLLKGTLNNARRTYQLITLMNAIMFCMGVGLFLFATIYGAHSQNLKFFGAFAGLGAASFVALFMLGPIDKTQEALSNLIQAEVAFMNYFDQMVFLEACAQLPAPGMNLPNVQNIERASALLQKRTEETLGLLQTFLETRPTAKGAKPNHDRASRSRHGAQQSATPSTTHKDTASV